MSEAEFVFVELRLHSLNLFLASSVSSIFAFFSAEVLVSSLHLSSSLPRGKTPPHSFFTYRHIVYINFFLFTLRDLCNKTSTSDEVKGQIRALQ